MRNFTQQQYDSSQYKDLLECSCDHCNKTFFKTKQKLSINIRRNQKNDFCSQTCLYKHQTTKINIKCTECQKEFLIKENQYKKYKNSFCSRSCAATYNNKTHIKRKPSKIYYCSSCNTEISIGLKNKTSKYCTSCRNNPEINSNSRDWSVITLKEFKSRFKNVHQYNARIRALARRNCEITPCVFCGYTTHVEVCHIKPISQFDENSFITEINHETNLICMCPNHHWEFDNGFIKL